MNRTTHVSWAAGIAVVAAVLGTSPAVAAGAIRIGSAHVIRDVSKINGVSCPGKGDCWASVSESNGRAGLVHVTNGVPSAPQPVGYGTYMVACPTTTACALLDIDGSIEWTVAGKPQATSRVLGMTSATAISCTSATACVVVGEHEMNAPPRIHSTGKIAFVTMGDKSVSAAPVTGTTSLQSVSCSGPSKCVAVGAMARTVFRSHGVVVPINGTRVGVTHVRTDLFEIGQVSCGTETRCLAIADSVRGNTITQYLVSIRDGKPVSRMSNPGIGHLACWSATQCIGVAAGSSPHVSRLVSGRITASRDLGSISFPLSTACSTAGSCLVSGQTSSDKSAVVAVQA